ncbi:MAG TPA: hypothetical protein VFD70_16510 [Anaerolineae bacterium]|nr:hypothetical protein [Anaerolineae bacterium]
MKHLKAFLAASLITGFIACAMFAIGMSAIFRNSTPVNAASDASNTVSTDNLDANQLRNLVNQYAARERQYQSQINNLNNQLDAANQQLAQYRNLLQILQQRGILQILANGQIRIRANNQ